MNQSLVAGIILIVFGLILDGKPNMIWEAAEKWKSQGAKNPSKAFIMISRILGGVFIILGILLLAGIVK